MYVLCVHTYRLVPGQYGVACMQLHRSRDSDPWRVFWGEIPNEYPQPGVQVPAWSSHLVRWRNYRVNPAQSGCRGGWRVDNQTNAAKQQSRLFWSLPSSTCSFAPLRMPCALTGRRAPHLTQALLCGSQLPALAMFNSLKLHPTTVFTQSALSGFIPF